MITWLLIAVISLAIVIAYRGHGPFTFVMAGLFVFLIYSVPAVLQLKTLFSYESKELRYLAEAGQQSGFVIFVAWATVAIILLITAREGSRLPLNSPAARQGSGPLFDSPIARQGSSLLLNSPVTRRGSGSLLNSPVAGRGSRPLMKPRNDAVKMHRYAVASLILGLCGYAYLSLTSGLLFFLEQRELQSDGILTLLWKWTVPLGIVAATLSGSNKTRIGLFALLAILFLRGDRTMLGITLVTFAIVWSHGRKDIATLFRPAFIIVGVVLFALIIFGKPVYLSAKAGDISILLGALSPENMATVLLGFEPFATYNHIDFAMESNLSISFEEFVSSLLGQFLMVPSFFGIETNIYSQRITEMLPYYVTFGIAGNYWAHAWSVGGFPMVAGFATLYALSLGLCDRYYARLSGAPKVFLAVTGGVIAVYTYRNGLDNLFSFFRQMLIVVVITSVLARLLIVFVRSPSVTRHTGLQRRQVS